MKKVANYLCNYNTVSKINFRKIIIVYKTIGKHEEE